jgi:ankyrin repeat protein
MGQRKRKSLNRVHQEQLCLDAIENDNPQQLNIALTRGADVNYTNCDRKSLFYLARKKNNPIILEILITHENIDIYSRDSEDFTPLHIACELGLHTTVESILKKDPQTACMCSKQENIPLHIAAYNWQKDCAELLLSHNINTINHQDNYNNTALHFVCSQMPSLRNPKPHFDTIKLLLERGADPTIKNNQQVTPLIYFFSCSYGHNLFLIQNPNIAHTFIHTKDKDDNSQFHLCATATAINPARFEQYLHFLTNHGLDIHSRNKYGKRAIDLAYDVYNHYNAMPSPDMKKFMVQKQIMYTFLRVISPHIEYALFALQQITDEMAFPPSLKLRLIDLLLWDTL